MRTEDDGEDGMEKDGVKDLVILLAVLRDQVIR